MQFQEIWIFKGVGGGGRDRSTPTLLYPCMTYIYLKIRKHAQWQHFRKMAKWTKKNKCLYQKIVHIELLHNIKLEKNAYFIVNAWLIGASWSCIPCTDYITIHIIRIQSTYFYLSTKYNDARLWFFLDLSIKAKF